MTKRYKVKRRDIPEDCPRCGSKNIEWFGGEAHGNYLCDAAQCHDCDFTWGTTWKYVKWSPTGKFEEVRGSRGKTK